MKVTKRDVADIKTRFRHLLDREYPDTREDQEIDEDVAFAQGMNDAFSMSFRALCEQAFPNQEEERWR